MSDFSPQIAPKRTSHLSQYMSTGANLLRLPDPPFLSLGQAQGSGTKDSLGGGIRVSYVPVKAVVLGKRRGSYVGSSLSLCCCWALCLVQCRVAGVSGDGCAVRVQQQPQNNGQQLVQFEHGQPLALGLRRADLCPYKHNQSEVMDRPRARGRGSGPVRGPRAYKGRWRRPTNVWRRVTSPRTGPERPIDRRAMAHRAQSTNGVNHD
jgi:hypothetical protein